MYLWLIFGSLTILSSVASTITLQNYTAHECEVALYTLSHRKGSRIGATLRIPPAQQDGTPGERQMPPPQRTSVFWTALTPQAPLVAYATILTQEQLSASKSLDPIRATTVHHDTKSIRIYPLGATVGTIETSDMITVHNTTDRELHCAVYYDNRGASSRFGAIMTLPPHAARTVIRPEHKCAPTLHRKLCTQPYAHRYLFVGGTPQELAEVISNRTAPSTPAHIAIGATQGSAFYVAHGERLQLFTEIAWRSRVVAPLERAGKELLFPHYKAAPPASSHPGAPGSGVARVVTTSAQRLQPEEQTYRERRTAQGLGAACRAFCGGSTEEDPLPTIGFCFSGGGCRAMISTIACMAEAERQQLLAATMYSCSLSGSTWALGGFMVSPVATAQEYLEILKRNIRISPLRTTTQQTFADGLTWAANNKKRVGLIDAYGIFLGTILDINPPLHQGATPLLWGALPDKIVRAACPFPLLTLATPETRRDEGPAQNYHHSYHLLVLDPYQTELFEERKAIPSFAFGRIFRDNVSLTASSPLPLTYILGACGSAMSINIDDIIRIAVSAVKPALATTLQSALAAHTTMARKAQQRTTFTSIPDFTDTSGTKEMRILDAGLYGMIPCTPLLDPSRSLTCMIVLDCGDSAVFTELQTAERIARINGQKFPPLPKEPKGASRSTPFGDCLVCEALESPDTPTIVYLAIPQEPGSTLSFEYSAEKFDRLVHTVQQLLKASIEDIRGAVQRKIAANRRKI